MRNLYKEDRLFWSFAEPTLVYELGFNGVTLSKLSAAYCKALTQFRGLCVTYRVEDRKPVCEEWPVFETDKYAHVDVLNDMDLVSIKLKALERHQPTALFVSQNEAEGTITKAYLVLLHMGGDGRTGVQLALDIFKFIADPKATSHLYRHVHGLLSDIPCIEQLSSVEATVKNICEGVDPDDMEGYLKGFVSRLELTEASIEFTEDETAELADMISELGYSFGSVMTAALSAALGNLGDKHDVCVSVDTRSMLGATSFVEGNAASAFHMQGIAGDSLKRLLPEWDAEWRSKRINRQLLLGPITMFASVDGSIFDVQGKLRCGCELTPNEQQAEAVLESLTGFPSISAGFDSANLGAIGSGFVGCKEGFRFRMIPNLNAVYGMKAAYGTFADRLTVTVIISDEFYEIHHTDAGPAELLKEVKRLLRTLK